MAMTVQVTMEGAMHGGDDGERRDGCDGDMVMVMATTAMRRGWRWAQPAPQTASCAEHIDYADGALAKHAHVRAARRLALNAARASSEPDDVAIMRGARGWAVTATAPVPATLPPSRNSLGYDGALCRRGEP